MRKKTSKKTARATFGRGQGRATRGLFRRCRALRLSALPRYALVFRASVHPGSRGAATFQCVGRPERRDARTDSGHERRLHQRRQRVRSAAPHRGAGIDQSHHADPRQCALSKMSHRPGIGQISRLRTVVLAHLLAQPQSHRTPVEIRQEGLFVLDLLQRLCALQTGHFILSRSNSNHTQGRPRHLAFPPLPDLQKIKNYATVEYSYEACSKDAAPVNSEKGRELERRLREYCAARTSLEVETALNDARIGCARVFGTPDQYNDEHYRAREMTAPVLDRQSGVPIRVYGVVPKMSLTPGRLWRGAPAVGEDTTDILSKMLGLSDEEIARLYQEEVVHRTEPFTSPQVEAVHP